MSERPVGEAASDARLPSRSHNVGAFLSMLAAMMLWGAVICMVGCATVREPETVTWETIYDN
jgi:hypothetical protein